MKSACLIGLFLLAAMPAHAAEVKSVDLTVGEYERSYAYSAPDGSAPAPVVLVLPDAGGHAADALDSFGWADLAHKKGFIAVGLEPLPVEPARPEMFQTNPGYWSDGSGRGNSKRGSLDDVEYAREVLDDLHRHGVHVDTTKVYATGLGNGGSMVHRLGIEMADRLVAIAPLAGHLYVKGAPARPLRVLIIVGAEDPVDPPNGGPGLNVWTHAFERRPAAQDSAEAWAKAMSCSGSPVTGTTSRDESWAGCTAPGSVHLLVVPGLGHHWAGGKDDHLDSLGPTDEALDATTYIWESLSAPAAVIK